LQLDRDLVAGHTGDHVCEKITGPRVAQLDDDFRRAMWQTLSGPQQEGHAPPAVVVDPGTGGHECFGL
jgi:hypothetical protein